LLRRLPVGADRVQLSASFWQHQALPSLLSVLIIGVISDTLGAALASDASLELIREGGPAMNSLDDNEVTIHHGTGNFRDLRIGKRGHATKIFLSDVDSGAVEVEAGGDTENIQPHAWSLLRFLPRIAD
jgi:hypothetical protein